MFRFFQGSEKKFGEKEKSSEKLMLLLAESPKITIAELSVKLGISTRAVEKNIRKLREAGKLKRIGGAKGGSWMLE